jgi:nucleotide-binding universal stress UspA family protein
MSDVAMEIQELPTAHGGPAATLYNRPPSRPQLHVISPTQNGHGKPVRKILVATDFSDRSSEAVELAVALARQCDATLTVLHVIDISAQSVEGERPPAAELMRRLWKRGFEEMGRLAFSLSGRVTARTVVEEGLPCEVIIEKSGDFDLLIIGRTCPRTSWGWFSHQTMQRVIQNAACPVIVAPESQTAAFPVTW